MDLGQFRETFIEEADEILEKLDAALLHLESNPDDVDTINEAFRGVHTLKGSSGSIGYTPISELTHGMEDALDLVREGELPFTSDLLDVLFRGFDLVRQMVDCLRDERPIDVEFEAARSLLQAVIDGGGASGEPRAGARALASAAEAPAALPELFTAYAPQVAERVSEGKPVWHVWLSVDPTSVQRGMGPHRFIQSLWDVGEILASRLRLDAVPTLEELDPERSYLKYDLLVADAPDEAALWEAFEFVRDESDIVIRRVTAGASAPTEAPKPMEQASAKARAPGSRDSDGASLDGGEPRARSANQESKSIRVRVDKLDALLNLVGELVIVRSRYAHLTRALAGATDLRALARELSGIDNLFGRVVGQLQDGVMSTVMVPIGNAFTKFHRLVRDYSRTTGKNIELRIEGEATEIDKRVVDRMGEPLMHLLRNSIDHGIESAEERRASGKSERGTVSLKAYHEGDHLVIDVRDDGRGIDPEKIRRKALEKGVLRAEELAGMSAQAIRELIFHPGFSTADKITDISGRGVGMDVVKTTIQGLRGTVLVDSVLGEGTVMRVVLPLTLAIVQSLLVTVGPETYAIPLSLIEEILEIDPDKISKVGAFEMIQRGDRDIPLIRIAEVLATPEHRHGINGQGRSFVVLVHFGNEEAGLVVDGLVGQREVVVKSLSDRFSTVRGVSGASILGDGTVCLMLDAPALAKLARERRFRGNGAFVAARAA